MAHPCVNSYAAPGEVQLAELRQVLQAGCYVQIISTKIQRVQLPQASGPAGDQEAPRAHDASLTQRARSAAHGEDGCQQHVQLRGLWVVITDQKNQSQHVQVCRSRQQPLVQALQPCYGPPDGAVHADAATGGRRLAAHGAPAPTYHHKFFGPANRQGSSEYSRLEGK